MTGNVIYGLLDPRTQECRYIGKSINAHARFKRHVSKTQLLGRTHKECWIASLVRDGLLPKLVVLEAFASEEDLNSGERFWIAQAVGLGWRLTNGTKGGDGTFTKAQRDLVAAWRRGRKHSIETRAKMSVAIRAANAKLPADVRLRIAAAVAEANKRRVYTAEMRKRISDAQRRRCLREGRRLR